MKVRPLMLLILSVASWQMTYALDCTSAALSEESPYQQLFYDRGNSFSQWLGGDNANSFIIDKNLYLWTFGDTYWGRFPLSPNSTRHIRSFTHDSFGLLNTDKMTMQFLTERGVNGKPESVLIERAPNHYKWILSGALVNAKVVLGLSEVEDKNNTFEVVETVYAIIDNPQAPFDNWSIQMVKLSDIFPLFEPIETYQWNVALVVFRNYLYIFGSHKDPKKATGLKLARIRVSDLISNRWDKMQFLIKDKANLAHYTSPPFDASRLKDIQGLPWMSEGALYYDKFTSRWYILDMPFLSYQVFLYSAKGLEGPWQKEGMIYQVPPPWSTTLYRGKHLYLSYAPKIHAEFKTESHKKPGLHFIFSYINNLNDIEIPGISQKKAKHIMAAYPGFYIPLLVDVSCH